MKADADLFTAHNFAEALFDALPDVVFFIKDSTGRYVCVNQTFADRCAGGDKAKLLHKRPEEVFIPTLARSYARQDASVLRTGRSVAHQLELHLYPNHKAGWCLTTKHALRDAKGHIVGVAGVSRDLNAPSEKAVGYSELAAALQYLRDHFSESIRIEDVANQSGLSLHQFGQKVRRLFHMAPMQLLHKLRLDEAMRLLREPDKTLAEIAIETGWCDQSAFTRHFTRYAGLAPGKYRQMQLGGPTAGPTDT